MIQKQSGLFTKTLRESPAGEEAANAVLLERGGFIYKNSAGIYTILPLGWRVLQKIAGIIREEMNAIGGQEMFMPSMVEKKYWEATKRWDLDVGFEAKGKNEEKASFVLGWSHEDLLTDLAVRFINSYKDLPQAVYQIQTKFRNEPRAKSGMLRGREFIMKDLYSLHTSEEDLTKYYDRVAEAYKKIFDRCGVKTAYTVAAGGDFTINYTHEFQALTEVGEDTIFICGVCEYAENKEISKLEEDDKCPKCGGAVKKSKGIEVGNIFLLGTRYSEAVGLKFTDEKGDKRYVMMGSYGIGLGRLMGTVVEVSHDDKGIIWPASVAPYDIHLIEIRSTKSEIRKESEELAKQLSEQGLEVLYDDRELSAGEKFADRDLLGIPVSVIVSEKGLADNSVEIVNRRDKKSQRVSVSALSDHVANIR